MRAYRRKTAGTRSRNDGSFWLSFSDLMSSLVLIIILVLFYIIYQYFNLAEINQKEIEEQRWQLEQAQIALDEERDKLADAEKQVDDQQILLDAKERELDDAQAELDKKQQELDDAQAELDKKQQELDDTQAALDEKERELGDSEAELDAKQRELDDAQARLDDQQAQLDEQQRQLDDQQRQIEELVGLKPRIIASLSDGLKQAGVYVSVDANTGSITLESDVLFKSGKHELTDAGRDFIDRFLPIYLDVLFSDEYSGFVSEIIIEGHTDSDGDYLDNLELSQQRALAVASYVLGDECKAISPEMKNRLRPVVTVNGRSYSDRIFNPDGTEDKDSSRRVVFKFRLTDEQMIAQLRDIMEAD